MSKAKKPKWTPDEQHAIDVLRALAKDWPASLLLVSAASTLIVCRPEEFDAAMKRGGLNAGGLRYERIHGIPNDGGDPW
jgi:hypothetical protein